MTLVQPLQTPSALTPEEFREMLYEARLDSPHTGGIRGAAKLMGISERALHHWRKGTNPVPEWTRAFVQMYGLLSPEQRQAFREMRS